MMDKSGKDEGSLISLRRAIGYCFNAKVVILEERKDSRIQRFALMSSLRLVGKFKSSKVQGFKPVRLIKYEFKMNVDKVGTETSPYRLIAPFA